MMIWCGKVLSYHDILYLHYYTFSNNTGKVGGFLWVLLSPFFVANDWSQSSYHMAEKVTTNEIQFNPSKETGKG